MKFKVTVFMVSLIIALNASAADQGVCHGSEEKRLERDRREVIINRWIDAVRAASSGESGPIAQEISLPRVSKPTDVDLYRLMVSAEVRKPGSRDRSKMSGRL